MNPRALLLVSVVWLAFTAPARAAGEPTSDWCDGGVSSGEGRDGVPGFLQPPGKPEDPASGTLAGSSAAGSTSHAGLWLVFLGVASMLMLLRRKRRRDLDRS